MKVIGFANKFYTLWEVSTRTIETKYDKYDVTTYSYIKNISFDKQIVDSLYPDLQFNEDLRGKSRSFEVEGTHKDINVDRFNFGKYENSLIVECSDDNYLRWFFDNCYGDRKEIVKSRLEDLGYHFEAYTWTSDYDGSIHNEYRIYSPSEWEIQEERNESVKNLISKLSDHNEIEILFERNLTVGQDEDDNYFGTYNFEYGIIHFTDITVASYAGYEYGLPAINGKGKRIKNKTVVLTDYEFVETGDSIAPLTIFVKKFNIKK